MKLKDRLEDLARKKEQAKRLTDEADAFRAEVARQEQELFEIMEAEDIRTLSTEDYTFTRKSTTYGSVEDPRAFWAWAEDTEQEDFFLPKPVGRRVNEIVRERYADGQELPPGLSSYEKPYVSITKRGK